MYETIIIGAGQAGIAIGYFLKKSSKKFLILDKNSEVGKSWQERYDSLVLFTPRMYSSLPGMEMQGDKHGFPTKNEVVSYLKKYVQQYDLPIKLDAVVINVSKKNDYYLVITNKEKFLTKNLVIATGPFQTPNFPAFSKKLSDKTFQLHSSEYINPTQLADGNVLVVGGGNSGAQIAVELSKQRETYLSHSKRFMFFPLIFNNKSIFWWFDKFGILKASNSSVIGRVLQKKGDPIFGYELKNEIKKKNVVLKERVSDVNNDKIIFNDLSALTFNNIIWATGFKYELPWLNISNLYDNEGNVIHERGKTPIDGLYFIGLPWQYRRGSALLQGVGYDAEYIVRHINKQ
ncbi:NAD(P)/FAD-dependent oxidoreductase [Niallia taxi]|uniref:flavin-containing monooxygenase n=1 Tax=Niallia taxi TaxID=2499688 RepID=UPI003175D9F7